MSIRFDISYRFSRYFYRPPFHEDRFLCWTRFTTPHLLVCKFFIVWFWLHRPRLTRFPSYHPLFHSLTFLSPSTLPLEHLVTSLRSKRSSLYLSITGLQGTRERRTILMMEGPDGESVPEYRCVLSLFPVFILHEGFRAAVSFLGPRGGILQ